MRLILAILVVVFSARALPDEPVSGKKSRHDDELGAPIYLGPFDLVPGIKIDQGYSDNLFSNDITKKGSWFTLIKPAIRLGYKRRLSSVDLSYGVQQSLYADSPADNFLDQAVRSEVHHEFTSRNKLDLTAAFVRAHDMRGSAFGQGPLATVTAEPDQFHSNSYSAKYQYGSDKAKGRIQLNLGFLEKQYTNHPERTALGNFQDYKAGVTFFYRWRPKTSLYLEADYDKLEYKVPPGGLIYDNSAYSYYLGATWKSTAKTTGNVKIGYLTKDFVDSRFAAFKAFTWQAGITWTPFRYSAFTLTATRDAMPTLSVGGSFIDQQKYSLDWKHAWSDRVRSTLGVALTNYDWVGLTPIRRDDLTLISLSLDYKLKRWLNLGASYSYGTRSSTQSVFDYSSNVFMLSLGATL